MNDQTTELEKRISELESEVRKLNRTLYGIQQLFKKAAEYEGRDQNKRRLP